MQTNHRETWLNMITDSHIRPYFQSKGYTIPTNVKMSCSFTSKGSKSNRIGECWTDSASEGGNFEIFISPKISDSIRTVDILIHELVHATVGIQAGHGKPFADCAKAVGLTGKMTATVATEELKAIIQEWVSVMGEYPHATLQDNGMKKQSTRMIKCVCSHCDYQVYTSRKWIAVSIPQCPDMYCEFYGLEMQVEQ